MKQFRISQKHTQTPGIGHVAQRQNVFAVFAAFIQGHKCLNFFFCNEYIESDFQLVLCAFSMNIFVNKFGVFSFEYTTQKANTKTHRPDPNFYVDSVALLVRSYQSN